MLLNNSFPFSTSSRIHILIGLSLGILVLFILFCLEPFNSGNTYFPYKTIYFTVYGIITFVTYFIVHLFSALYFKSTGVWKFFEEIIFCLIFIVFSIIIAFFFTEIAINKKPERLNLLHFLGWFEAIFLGFGILICITTILIRKQYTRPHLKNKPDLREDENLINAQNITITGSLKKEFFLVNEKSLVYVKSENNYVRIFYFEENSLKEKLLRSTLANIKKQLSSFIKIHRSYIVNPNFILSLNGNKQNAKLYLKKTERSIPISEPFFDTVNTLYNNHK